MLTVLPFADKEKSFIRPFRDKKNNKKIWEGVTRSLSQRRGYTPHLIPLAFFKILCLPLHEVIIWHLLAAIAQFEYNYRYFFILLLSIFSGFFVISVRFRFAIISLVYMAVNLVRFLDEWKEMRTEPIMRTSSEKEGKNYAKTRSVVAGFGRLGMPRRPLMTGTSLGQDGSD